MNIYLKNTLAMVIIIFTARNNSKHSNPARQDLTIQEKFSAARQLLRTMNFPLPVVVKKQRS